MDTQIYNNQNVPIMNKDIENQSIEASMRIGFIRKVYGLLSIQLLITVAIVL
jgi:FtsH-binding integral membrane protein